MRNVTYEKMMDEIQTMCDELMATKAHRSTGHFRQDRYENEYDRREGITMPITAFDKDLLFYD